MTLVKQYPTLTVTEKILLHSIVEGDMIRGSRIGIKAHQTLGHDLNAIMTFLALESMGIEKVDTDWVTKRRAMRHSIRTLARKR